jgi:hypothetical protein
VSECQLDYPLVIMPIGGVISLVMLIKSAVWEETGSLKFPEGELLID